MKPTVWVLDLYAADGTTPNRSGVELVRRSGGRAVCYVSAGSWEQWRPDAGSFPKEVRGKVLGGWPGERWLDIRALGTLRPLLVERAKKCRDAGFRAIDWDNVDGYTNNSGFALDGGDQIAFATMLADIAHDLDLAVGLKNNLEQVPELVSLFDFAVNEQCAQFNECQLLDPFVRNAKVVVQIEYSTPTRKFCSEAIHARRTAMVMGQDLHTHPWLPCR